MTWTKIFSTEFLKNLFKLVCLWASVAFIIFYMPIIRFGLLEQVQLTHDALVLVLGGFVLVTSSFLAYMLT